MIERGLVSIHKGKPFVIAQSSASLGWGYYSHPFLLEVQEGMHAVIYNMSGDVDAGNGLSFSTDGGITWRVGARQGQIGQTWNWAEGTEKWQVDPNALWGLIVRSDGARVISGSLAHYPGATPWTHVGLAQSCLDGKTWSDVQQSFYAVPPSKDAFSMSSRGVVLRDGGLVVAGYANFTNADFVSSPKENNQVSTIMLRSDDNGVHWNFWSVVARPRNAPWGCEGPSEPALAILPSGEMICIMRTGAGGAGDSIMSALPMLMARSSDSGKTWKYEKLTVPGVMPKLLLMSNGILVCAFGRPGNSLMISLDGGRTWGRGIPITSADIKTSGYCDIAEVSPGKLLVVYDEFDTSLSRFWLWDPPHPVNGVFGVFVDVSR